MADQELILSVPEAGRILNVSRGSAYKLIPRLFPTIKVGSRILVLRKPFERILNGEEGLPPEEADAPEEAGS